MTAGQSFENHLFRLQQLHVKMEGELRAKRWINNQQTQIQQQKDFFLHLFRILAAGSSWLSLSSFSPNSPWQVLKKDLKKFSHFHGSLVNDQSSFADRIGAYSRLQWEPTGSYLQINFPTRILKRIISFVRRSSVFLAVPASVYRTIWQFDRESSCCRSNGKLTETLIANIDIRHV